MSSGPECRICGATTNTEFRMFNVKQPGFTFGEICVPCDDKAYVCSAQLCARDAEAWWGGSPYCGEHHGIVLELAREGT